MSKPRCTPNMTTKNPHSRIVQDANVESGRILASLNDLMRSCGPGATEADAKAAVELRDSLRALYALMLASE